MGWGEDVLEAVPAEFEGRCSFCDEPIEEDELIVRIDGDWVHAECAEDDGYEVSEP